MSIRGSARASAYFDLARAVSFDPTVLNLVAIRPYMWRPTTQAGFAILRAFVARWYADVLQLHTRLEVELDHGRGGARSRAGCPPSKSSGAKVHVQLTVTAIFDRFMR